jgi:hypothetical protein
MLAKLRSCLTYANVVATVAVFVALGGTSYAIATGSIGSREIENNSVGTKDLRNSGVRGRDVRNGTIRSADVGNGSLLAADFNAGQLPAGERGAQGLPGQDATKLFAYIRDSSLASNAMVEYGSGVTGVTDPVGNSAYTVTFNRSVTNCAVLAVPGIGDPAGMSVGQAASPLVAMSEAGPDGVSVHFSDKDGVIIDTAFLIAAFC